MQVLSIGLKFLGSFKAFPGLRNIIMLLSLQILGMLFVFRQLLNRVSSQSLITVAKWSICLFQRSSNHAVLAGVFVARAVSSSFKVSD